MAKINWQMKNSRLLKLTIKNLNYTSKFLGNWCKWNGLGLAGWW